MSKSVKFMLDGMTDKPIAIPFPFRIGSFVIQTPYDWHWFRQHYADMVVSLKNMVEIEERNAKGDPDYLVSDRWQEKWLKQAQQTITDATGGVK